MENKELEKSVVVINAMANVLSAMKDTYFPDRSEKDNIVRRASEIVAKELTNIENS